MRGSDLSHSEASLPTEAMLPKSVWDRWVPGSHGPPPPAPASQPPPPTACTSPQQLLGDAAPRARYYHWAGPSQAGGVLNCPVCEKSFPLEVDLRTHYHQFHLNPHHLSPQDVHLYRLSNFLVRLHPETDESTKTDFPGLYRCHQCFNLFNQISSLVQHLATHEKSDPPDEEMPTRTAAKVEHIPIKAVKATLQVEQKATKVNKLLSKVEELLAKQTEVDAMPHKVDKLSREDFEDVVPRPKKRRRPEKRRQNQRVELSRKSRSLGLLKLESMVEVEEEMVSAAEEEDSDSGVEETTKESRRPQRECKSRTSTLVAISLAEQEYEQFDLDFGRYKSDVNKVSDMDLARIKNTNKRVLLDKDNIPIGEEEKDEALGSPGDELNERSLSPKDDVLPDSKSTSSKEAKGGSKKTDSKGTVSSKSAKARKRRKNRSSSVVSRKVKLKDQLKSEGEESSTKENDLDDELVELEGSGPEKRRSRGGKSESGWVGMKGAEMEKAKQVVQEVLAPPPAFVCLHCKAEFSDYVKLKSHRQGCNPQKMELCKDSKDSSSLKSEVVKTELSEDSLELFEYVTGSVTDIPETTFNNMHGKINDLRTKDANIFAARQLNEIGLVKLNYSGPWSVAEVWENAGWEQREDQLTWQQYEVAAAGGDQRDRGQGRQGARKVPFIMDRKASRQFLVKLSTLPWSEQRKIKEKLDQTLVVKKSRRSEKLVDPTIRQSGLPARLELRQVGKSIKYMKAQEREAVKEMIGHSIEKELVHGELSGEWEQEFSFVCSVCAIEYDDVLEIMHHKWEAHPHCLVTHVSLREGLQRPPTLLYPQVGPSMVYPFPPDPRPQAPARCSKCSAIFPPQATVNFHAHLLTCGGVQEWDAESSKKKRKKRRWNGGGLKRTVRMIQKSLSHEGTDTDGESPRKRVRAPPRVVEPVPAVPTHNRTTRFKETKQKEARKEAAKKRRIEARNKKRGRPTNADAEATSSNSAKRKILLDSEEPRDEKPKGNHVVNGQMKRKTESKSRTSSSSQSSSSSSKANKRPRRIIKPKPGNFVKDSAKRATALRPRQMNLYKEETSESDSDSRSSIDDPVDPMMEITEADFAPEVPTSVLEAVSEIIDSVIEGSRTPRKTKSRHISTPPIQTPTKAVPVRIEDDLNLVIVNDLEKSPTTSIRTDKLALSESREERSVRSLTPPQMLVLPKQERKKIYLDFTEPPQDANPSDDVAASVENEKAKLIATTAPEGEDSRSKLTLSRSDTTSVGFSSEKRANRTLKRLETDLVEVAADQSAAAGKRRNSFEQAKRKKIQPPLRVNLPLEVKISAIERVEDGEALAVVSRDLDISITSLSAWLMRKTEIRSRWQQERDGESLVEKELPKESEKKEADEKVSNSNTSLHDSSHFGNPEVFGENTADEVLAGQPLQASSSPRTKSAEGASGDPLMSDIAASLGLTRRVKRDIEPKENPEKKGKSQQLLKYEPNSSEEPQEEISSKTKTSPEDEEEKKPVLDGSPRGNCSDILTQNGNENDNALLKQGEKISTLPLADLFKSMKSAFAVKCPSHSGDLKKSPSGPKKSVDSLATSLMERAVAKSLDPPSSSSLISPSSTSSRTGMSSSQSSHKTRASSPTSTPPTSDLAHKADTPLAHTTADRVAPSKPIHHSEPSKPNNPKSMPLEATSPAAGGQLLASSEPIQTSPAPPLNASTANQRAPSGLAMIGACYCSSSDDEL